jgi:predicted N-acetyltransferase YhbS
MKREKNELLQMNKTVNIRNEVENDYKKVEEITRRAFWNLYVPGCIEHYLVHVMRSHEDFLPELDFVIEVDNQVIGNSFFCPWIRLTVGFVDLSKKPVIPA